MLRVEFTTEDLARLRIGTTYGPLVETALALRAAQPGDKRALFTGWRQRLVMENAGPSSRLVQLFPRLTYFDLIGFTGRASTMEEGLDTFQRRPERVIDAEIDVGINAINYAFDSRYRPPTWVSGLLDRGASVRGDVAGDLLAFHQSAVAPFWPRIQARLHAEHARLVWTLAEQGADAVLRSLHPPTIRWNPPHLEIDGVPGRVTNVELAGRSMLIVPSFFCSPAYPTSMDVVDPDAPVVLMYPAVIKMDDAMGVWSAGPPNLRSLAALVGQTRTMVLMAIAERPCTTGEIAQRAATSLASASQHATVLRKAGLITTQREGPAVRHQLTMLGFNLIG